MDPKGMMSKGKSIVGPKGVVACWETNNGDDEQEEQPIIGLLEGLESCVEQCREWRSEWKASNQEMESKYENCKAKVGAFLSKSPRIGIIEYEECRLRNT